MVRILYIFLFLIPFSAFGQRPGAASGGQKVITGTLSGTLLDSITRKPMEYVSVGIINPVTARVVNGGISDELGIFRIAGIPTGLYKVQVSYVGYETRELNEVRLTLQKPDFDCGEIILHQVSQLLEEIKVIGEAALIEARPDKLVYNAERDITSKGGDAADVLRKVPMLTVDFDGNVTLRGSENVTILINGRPSAMFNASIADALKMMPADQIKAVEVITAPSAKYDGDGTAGIINIITKKKNIEGIAGSADVTVGTRSNRANMNLNYGKGRLGANLSGGGHYSWPQEGATYFRREEFGSLSQVPSLLAQDGTNTSSRLGFRTHGGLEYNFNAYNTFNTSVSMRGYKSETDNDVMSSYSIDHDLMEAYHRTNAGLTGRTGWDWEGDYKKTFQKPEQDWSFAFELDKDLDPAESDYYQSYTNPEDFLDTKENNIDDGNSTELTLQTDYTHPFSEMIKLETGLKGTLRHIISDFQFSRYDADVMEWVIDPSRTDIFYYDQDVFAGYINSSVTLDEKTTLIAGLRFELTDLQGSFEVFESPFASQYNNLLPNFTISRKTGEYNLVKISYNQRIQRPNLRHINPYVEYNDNRDIYYGNPTLRPELVHQVEIGSTVFLKDNMVSVSVFGRRTEDLIESLLRINEEGVSETTYENFGVRSALGVNIFGSAKASKRITIRGGFDVNAWGVEGIFDGEDLTNSGFDYNGRINMTWSIHETFRMEGFAYFRSPTYTVQGQIPSWSMMSLAVKKEFFQRRLTIGLNITNPFSENQEFVREMSGDDFYQYNRTVRPTRSFGINLGYQFGKMDFNERSGKKKMNNSDQKEEEQGGENQF